MNRVTSAVILAAGKGTRLGAIGEATPKPLLPVRGKPILLHNLERCAAAGVTSIFINTHHLPGRVRALCGNGDRYGVRIEYSFEPELLGTAGALAPFRHALEKDDFLLLYGDNLVPYDLTEIVDFHRARKGIATIALFTLEDVSLSGIALFDADGRIERFIEKPGPEERISHWVNAGVYVLSPRIFSWIPEGFSDFAKDVFPMLIRRGEPVYGCAMQEKVIAVDTPELLEQSGRERADEG